MLSDYPEGYTNLKSLWDEISSLHKKLVNFIAVRLATKYKIVLNNTVPVHLLGKSITQKKFMFTNLE